MYESFFGLTGLPFLLNPDRTFLFDGKSHRDALAALQRGFDTGARVMVVTGEVGAGKTTLLQTFLESVDRGATSVVHVSAARLDAEVLSERLSKGLGLPWVVNADDRRAALLAWLLSRHQPLLLVIDEAQHLAGGAFGLLEAMATPAASAAPRLQICLVGQPELRILLNGAERARFREQIDLQVHLGPLDAAETRQYVEHRLRTVGWSGRPALEDAAFFEIFVFTAGVPRRINLLCNSLLLSAYLMKQQRIDAAAVTRATAAMRGDSLHGMPDLSETGPQFELPAASAEEAEADARRVGEPVGCPWSCPGCGSVNAASAPECWNCRAAREPDSAVSDSGLELGSPQARPILGEDPPAQTTPVGAVSEGPIAWSVGAEQPLDAPPAPTAWPESAADSNAAAVDQPAGSESADGLNSKSAIGRGPAEPINPRLAALSREPELAKRRRRLAIAAGSLVLAVVLAVIGLPLQQASVNIPLPQNELRAANGTVVPAVPALVRDTPAPATSASSSQVTRASKGSVQPTNDSPDPRAAADAVTGTAPASPEVGGGGTESALGLETASPVSSSAEPTEADAKSPPAAATLRDGAARPPRRESRAARQPSRSVDGEPRTRLAPAPRPDPGTCTANAAVLGLCGS